MCVCARACVYIYMRDNQVMEIIGERYYLKLMVEIRRMRYRKYNMPHLNTIST